MASSGRPSKGARMVSIMALKGLSASQAARSPNCSGNQMIGVRKKASCISEVIIGGTSRNRAQIMPRKKAAQKALHRNNRKPARKAKPLSPGDTSKMNITAKISGRLWAATMTFRTTVRSTCTVKDNGICRMTPSAEIKQSDPSVMAWLIMAQRIRLMASQGK